jgi:hypothetical protein
MRTRWWPRFLLTGVLLAVAGAALLSGVAQTVVAGLGALVIFVIFIRALSAHDYSHEPPIPPGTPCAAGHRADAAAHGDRGNPMMDQKRKPAFRRWLDRRKLRRIELLERKNIARTTLRGFRQQTGDENRY